MAHFQLVQINVAKIKGVTINDSVMKEFVDNLNIINQMAENSKGFVWRLKDETNNATHINPYNDEKIIINLSVWQTIEDLEYFVYKTMHADFLRRRKEWFESFGQPASAMWWIEAGQFPTILQAVEKLNHLQKNGASPFVFDYKNKYPHP